MLICRRFGTKIMRIRSGEFDQLEMMSPAPRAGLDRRMAEVMVVASIMKFKSIELEVWFCLLCDLVLAVASLMWLAVLLRVCSLSTIR
jgi:hypothetical protein